MSIDNDKLSQMIDIYSTDSDREAIINYSCSEMMLQHTAQVG